MHKKILVITGSARENGNSSLMADALISGAQASGHTVLRFDAGKKNILGCINCDTCFSKGDDKACSFDDVYNEVAPYILTYDTIVFCTPLYWYTFPAEVKAVIDKIYSLVVTKKVSKIQESMLLVCGEREDLPAFDGIIKSYELIAEDRKWTDLGHYIAPGVVNPGDIKKGNQLAKIKEIGRHI